ncbi:MAG: STT3 domain-containing protein [Candidatus Woesearchaeota archaeon]
MEDNDKINELDRDISKDITKEETKIKELKQEVVQEREMLDELKKEKEELEKAKEIIEEKEEDIQELEQEKGKEEDKVEKIEEEVKEIKEEYKIDLKNSFKGFFKKNKYVLPVLLILIAIFFSTYFRMYPASLPATEDWAENSVYNFYRNQITGQINQQYPNLPDQNKQALVNSELDTLLKTNKDKIEDEIEGLSARFKSQLQYTAENGKDYTYLLAIDPYLWYGYGKNYLECKHNGCDLREDGKYYNYRNGREGKDTPTNYITFVGTFIYKISSIFSNIPLMYAFFLIPVLMIGLSIIPAFFIGKKLGGNLGGFFSAMIIAVNSALLGRTPAGFSDTDSANILFPLLIMWFFLEAFYAKDWKKTTIYSVLGGISFFIYGKIWFVEHIFDFIIVAVGIYILIILVNEIRKTKKIDFKNIANKLKAPLSKSGIFIGISLLFIVLGSSLAVISRFVTLVIGFAFRKDVAVNTLWPNVLTTVAEFNEVPFGQIVQQMGGGILFFIAILGIIFCTFKKNKEGQRYIMYSALIAIWFLGTAYSFTQGIRFAILMVPAFAIAFGVGIGIIYEYLNKWVSKELKLDKKITATVLIILACLLLVVPIKAAHGIAKNEIPSYNDAWDATLDKINMDAEDGIGYITTWWDFGHWFVAHDIRVTFDGGDQGERIHWVGKSLLTDSEEESIGILRMLNCGQQKAPHVLEEYLDGDTVKAIDVLNEIMLKEKDGARSILKKEGLDEIAIEEVLEVTHCDDLLPQYYIASEDMVGKAGVWGHFGSWDFERAKMWQTVSQLEYDKGIKTLEEEFGLDEEQADEYYYEIKNTPADRWIAPWPNYVSGKTGCVVEDNVAKCVANAGQLIPVEINLKTYEAIIPSGNGELHPNSLVYVDGNDVKKKEYNKDTIGFSAILVPEGNSYYMILSNPSQAYSMFTRLFFFKGHGLKHFDLLDQQRQVTGAEIYNYKVDWEGKSKADVY